jgi:hypothetical protein
LWKEKIRFRRLAEKIVGINEPLLEAFFMMFFGLSPKALVILKKGLKGSSEMLKNFKKLKV